MLRDPTSRGLYVRVWPPHIVSGAGEGEVVSKKVGKEVRGAQGGDRSSEGIHELEECLDDVTS